MSNPSEETIFSFHLTKSSWITTLQSLYNPPNEKSVPGLKNAECMTVMTLGAAILSPKRMQLNHLAMFAEWENEVALEMFVNNTKLGRVFSGGWHVRMTFLRRWGQVAEFSHLPEIIGNSESESPVVAVTLARMRLLEVPRFIHWGKPVEKLVRDHPGKTLALAAMRLPRTVSTFTIWKSQDIMREMVTGTGHSKVDQPKRHATAMKERERKDFHFEFTTLRFKPIAEYGSWQGETNLIPKV
ncbi:MAG: hypothetical protein SFY68_04965 [Candidatus Sumerlaeia bacterium]|nr:hypothetical protein [Candidatus Sumerlaeia bacterium]